MGNKKRSDDKWTDMNYKGIQLTHTQERINKEIMDIIENLKTRIEVIEKKQQTDINKQER